MNNQMEAELSVGPRAIEAYSRLSYTMWFALAEFVDNSTQSRMNHKDKIDPVLKTEGTPLTVSIVHDRMDKKISIEDNSIGMSKDVLLAALKIAQPTSDSRGRSKYGMGMKTAACWIGNLWSVTTSELGSTEEWTAEIDIDRIANHGAKVPLSVREVDADSHYTSITIGGLRRVVQKRTEETIKAYLGSMYMFDLRPDEYGETSLKLTYNGEEVNAPDESEWDTDPSGKLMMRTLPEIDINNKTVTGWIGILRKGGRKFGGFSLYQNERQIQGYPSAWKPNVIFGGVDSEGANNLVAQRLTGVLLLDGFGVSHTKDKILFESNEEEELEKYLVEQTKSYVEYAKSRRGSGRGPKWSRDQVRDLVNDMRSEFSSAELKDAINNAALPPVGTIEENNRKQLESLNPDDEIGRYNVNSDINVIIWIKETSPYEPHVIFVPGAEETEIHVIINGLHPYYQTLEAKDAIQECIQQYIYDAVAEFKATKLIGKINPDSVRILKDNLLRARALQLDNATSEIKENAEEELFNDVEDD